ncbi:hexaprenyldihydroxybenzoate methyltransferase [Moniliophthora roreri MCA 2997]|uniref:Hexaprenyldihydroxybenzoate methyltransferase n=2 Tax=Moniliophthora roreri TaxID=221103 RepID=V2WYY9_MONRO|nr:hexaprenyldihydroxybenzoate methyltransferase [Moniliophthora roreri MCA 2997]
MVNTNELYCANQAHWDRMAKDLDKNPWGIAGMKLARSMLPHILEAVSFDKEKTQVMDFACGNGFNSSLLAPYSKSILGVDISSGMVDEYNRNVERWSLDKKQLNALRADIEDAHGTELEGKTFDVIYCSMVYHHFPSIEETTKVLATYLKPGGTLLVIDWIKPETEEEYPDEIKPIMKVAGIGELEMKEAFVNAGLRFRSYDPAVHFDEMVDGRQVNNKAFLACADK